MAPTPFRSRWSWADEPQVGWSARRTWIGWVAFGVMTLVALAASLVPVGAQTNDGAVDREEIRQIAKEAFDNLQFEIIVLVELDAFPRPLPFELDEIWSNGRMMLADLDRNDLLDELDQVDETGQALLIELRRAGAFTSHQTEATLGLLSDHDFSQLERNQIIGIMAQDYVGALYDLRERDGAPPAGGPTNGGVGAIDPRTGQPTEPFDGFAGDPARDDQGGFSPSDFGGDFGFNGRPGDEPEGPPVAAIVLGAVVLIALGGAGALLLRRGSSRSPTVAVVSDPASTYAGDLMARLLEAGRRMTKALERAEIARIAVAESVSIAHGTHGAFIGVAADGTPSLVNESLEGLIDVRRMDQGALGRVTETGQPANLVSADEPSLTSLPAALVLTPVIGGGRVTGVVVVVRPDERPFSSAEHQALQQLAPMIGSALDAAAQHDSVERMTMTDGLTNLANRRRLDQDLAATARRPASEPLGFVMVDVDHFKTYNDTHGHAAGDECLKTVAELLGTHVRDGDIVYRYGGEEFSVLLLECEVDEGAMVVERLRAAIESHDFPGGSTQPGGRVTASFGLAFARSADAEAIKVAADQALYRAKESGRNRVEVTDLDDPAPEPV